MDDLKELRRLAEAAKGWKINAFRSETPMVPCVFGREDDGEFYEIGTLDCENYDQSSEPLAQYLIAANPRAVLSLLDRLEALQTTKDVDAVILAGYVERGNALQAENEALRKDAERIDWMEAKLFDRRWNGVLGAGSNSEWSLAGPYRHIASHMVGDVFRDAIDAAMKEGAK